jgi:hypothetical protein
VLSWWGPSWRDGSTDTQGVSTDAALGVVLQEVEAHPLMKVALHMEPYPGGQAAAGGCAPGAAAGRSGPPRRPRQPPGERSPADAAALAAPPALLPALPRAQLSPPQPSPVTRPLSPCLPVTCPLLPAGRSADSFREDVMYLVGRHSSSGALLRLGGRPLYYVYDSYRTPAQDWAELLCANGSKTVRGTEYDGEGRRGCSCGCCGCCC